MSSSTPIRSPERDQEMLAVGRQCSHLSCHLVDFLPFKCQHCADSFCADHFKPASHNCSKYDESKYDRVAPDCPLCNEPVAIPPGEDPNIRMERHLTTDCSVMTGRSRKAGSTPKCARPKCGKVLFAQIQCDKCHQKFCPEHRFPNSHNCSSLASSSPSVASTPSKASSQSPVTTTSGMAAMKRAAASVKAAVSSPAKAPSASRPPEATAPSSGVERESQIRAMRARAQRGLLSEDEKVILASLEAQRAHGSNDKDCVAM
ncbi:hypothetical protein BJV78DRAFT_1275015 [Lactifluus subvellereus]|nr:hypothetical protein BJV78DRAFT_1275015 [Lactifluus subvellereus]